MQEWGYIINLHNTADIVIRKITIFPDKSISFKENNQKNHFIIVKGSATIQIGGCNKNYYYENEHLYIPKKKNILFTIIVKIY